MTPTQKAERIKSLEKTFDDKFTGLEFEKVDYERVTYHVFGKGKDRLRVQLDFHCEHCGKEDVRFDGVVHCIQCGWWTADSFKYAVIPLLAKSLKPLQDIFAAHLFKVLKDADLCKDKRLAKATAALSKHLLDPDEITEWLMDDLSTW